MTPEPTPVATPTSRPVAADGPGRSQILMAGLGMLVAGAVVELVRRIPLPFDETFLGVLYLMWSSDVGQVWIPVQIATVVQLMTLVAPLFLIAWAIVWPRAVSPLGRGLLRGAYRLAPFWPLYLLVLQCLGRVTANIVYALAPLALADWTPALARLEGPILELLQRRLETPWLGGLFADVYSWVWLMGLFWFGPWLLVRGRDRASAQALVGTVLTSLLAIPFFILLPVFDPWATNPAYGYHGAGQTAVRYLYPNPDVTQLSMLAVERRWATGACLPSLHIAFPLLYWLIAAQHRLRLESWLLGALTVITSLAVVYLGRHWIVDLVAAIPFAFAIRWLVGRLDPDFTLPWPDASRAD
jgi:PAP2 superfamily protein